MEDRIIKFRAFDVKDNKMKYSFNEHDEQGMIHHLEMFFLSLSVGKDLNDKSFKLMQFTGLHDRHGKEIYEGGIVKWDDRSNGKYWREAIVQFAPDIQYKIIGGNLKGQIFRHGCFAYSETTEIDLEIIGNIYQSELTATTGD